MYWQHKNGKGYLGIKKDASSNDTTAGVQSPETEERLAHFTQVRERLRQQIAAKSALISAPRLLRLAGIPRIYTKLEA